MYRGLDVLDQDFRAKLELVLADCKAKSVTLVPYYTLRLPSEQAKLWRQSRSSDAVKSAIKKLRNGGAPWLASVLEGVGPQRNGPWATSALPGFSWHNWGEAVDCYVRKTDGKPDWKNLSGYHLYALNGKKRGLHALRNMADPGHLQLRKTEIPNIMSFEQIDATMKQRFEHWVDE